MVAPEHLRFWDRMSCPSLGDIRNMQPPPLAPFTSASKRTGWHRYRQFPSLPKSPARIYEVSFKFVFSRPLLKLTKTASPPCVPPPQCYYSLSPLPTVDNLVLHAAVTVCVTGPHRSTGDQGDTHRRVRSSSLLQDPNTRVMLSHFSYLCFLDFYFSLHSCK
jgi:hypothetical protein